MKMAWGVEERRMKPGGVAWVVVAVFLMGLAGSAEARAGERCPVCGGKVVEVATVRDDAGKPSVNLAVWNRSGCANLFFGKGSLICPRDGYAYDAERKRWELAREDRDGFALGLDRGIYEFPLPEKKRITSRTVYAEEFVTGGAVTHSLLFWVKGDEGYFGRIRAYAKAKGVKLTIERQEGEAVVRASVTGRKG